MARLLLSECPNGSLDSSTDLACYLWSFGLVADWPFDFPFDAWLQDNLSMSDPGLAGCSARPANASYTPTLTV